jgi:hypothetical protein
MMAACATAKRVVRIDGRAASPRYMLRLDRMLLDGQRARDRLPDRGLVVDDDVHNSVRGCRWRSQAAPTTGARAQPAG